MFAGLPPIIGMSTSTTRHTHREGTQPYGRGVVLASTSSTATDRLSRCRGRSMTSPRTATLKPNMPAPPPGTSRSTSRWAAASRTTRTPMTSFIFQNPGTSQTAARPVNNLYSLAPSNKAKSVNVSGGVGLPWNSRYMGTFQYTKMHVDDATCHGRSIRWFWRYADIPTPNRDASTTLFNNVLHTQITPDLKSTLNYRYYNYDTDDDCRSLCSRTGMRDPKNGFTGTGATRCRDRCATRPTSPSRTPTPNLLGRRLNG